MKISNLLLIVIAAVAFNLRVDFDGGSVKPIAVISCSTEWSLRWGKGFIGVFSLESASKLVSGSFAENIRLNPKSNQTRDYRVARDQILRACK